MITITAFKWVPPFAQGNVRDHRVRWVLNEVGWQYRVRLLDAQDQKSAGYRAAQPFGQVPILEEDGRPTLFETGAILLDVTRRANRLLPAGEDGKALAVCWLFAALNSVEPFLMNLAEVDFFLKDEAEKARRRPVVMQMVHQRLEQLSAALGEKEYLVGPDFTVADLAMSSVLKLVGHTDILDKHPNLAAFRDRCLSRPAYARAIADQMADFAAHGPTDMRYGSEA